MSKMCSELHRMINKFHTYRFPFDERQLPSDGIYFLFETNEIAHGTARIVRIGSHTGDGRLPSRLKEHFVKENKDRSIFRKNIGRALLNKEQDPFLEQWELDLTSRKDKEQNRHVVDHKKLQSMEKRVTEIIQNNFWFCVLPINQKDRRLRVESQIVSTISYCSVCGPSKQWLGLYSPSPKIQGSGLWQVNHLYKEPFSQHEFDRVIKDISM